MLCRVGVQVSLEPDEHFADGVRVSVAQILDGVVDGAVLELEQFLQLLLLQFLDAHLLVLGEHEVHEQPLPLVKQPLDLAAGQVGALPTGDGSLRQYFGRKSNVVIEGMVRFRGWICNWL